MRKVNILKVRVTAAQRQENKETVSGMARNLVQKGKALNGGARKVFL